jgi:hypothetical protein
MMKPVYLILVASVFLVGCIRDRLSSDGNLGRYYQPYSGTQTNWPTSPQGGFITTYKEFTIYHGYPPVPYTVLGRFDRPNIPLFRVAKSARYHHANAIMMSEQPITEIETQHGVVFGNQNFIASTPSTTRESTRTEATAYLIRVNQP